jgi:hypothetical protein
MPKSVVGSSIVQALLHEGFVKEREATMATGPTGPNVTITPVKGTGLQQVGMFDISVTPSASVNPIENLQFISQIEGQGPLNFASFVLIGTLPENVGLTSAIFYASCNAVKANQRGVPLTVVVTGGTQDSPWLIPQTFTGNLWPGATCSMF